jgi:hypothetical protein
LLSICAGSGGGAEAEPVQHRRQGEDRDADQGGRGHHPLCPRIEAADAESASGKRVKGTLLRQKETLFSETEGHLKYYNGERASSG